MVAILKNGRHLENLSGQSTRPNQDTNTNCFPHFDACITICKIYCVIKPISDVSLAAILKKMAAILNFKWPID